MLLQLKRIYLPPAKKIRRLGRSMRPNTPINVGFRTSTQPTSNATWWLRLPQFVPAECLLSSDLRHGLLTLPHAQCPMPVT
jgi:hypothetical protein